MRTPARLRRSGVVLTAGAMLLTGCGLGSAGGFVPSGKLSGAVSDVKPLNGAEIAIGSKNFTEQILLGKIAIIMLKSAGATVTDLTNIPGSSSARQAQVQGDIQIMWEYTGTGWINYLGHTDPIPDERKQYVAVRDEDAKKNALRWLPSAPLNNTYGMAVKSSVAKKYGLNTMSDMKKVPQAERTFCVESEFASRNDGFEPMLKKYGLPLGSTIKKNQVKTLDTGAIYAATGNGLCTFGEVFTTDGRIKALNLKVLEDDKSYFPKYNASLVVANKTLEAYPQIKELFAPVAAKLTNNVLLELNRQIDVDGREPGDVAFDWLTKQGLITE
ncbi:glycine betaine ABC transporter substrate-binding protein [Demetria terragena]|uniref:glycine betaine ABC transporter substrate-binding protein n=1 Tax=Demetria terragena TaxID=63959 RepID=UPI0003608529|nr:glycine betaine ABC transporter substrate-binding protein [Demetria terragena]